MQNRRRYSLFILTTVLLLMCVVALNTLFIPSTARAAQLYGTPTPTPTHSVSPTPTHTVTSTPTPAPGTACKVTYKVDAQWNSSFTAELTLANTGTTPINGWTLQFIFPNGQVIQSAFNASFVQTGANVSATNFAWDGTIAPGTTLVVIPGFTATWNNIANNPPASFTLNGVLCSKG